MPITITAVVATQGANLNLRTGPGLTHAVVGSVPLGQSLTVTGVSADGGWLRVNLPDVDGSAWVYAPLITMQADIELPVVEELAAAS